MAAEQTVCSDTWWKLQFGCEVQCTQADYTAYSTLIIISQLSLLVVVFTLMICYHSYSSSVKYGSSSCLNVKPAGIPSRVVVVISHSVLGKEGF